VPVEGLDFLAGFMQKTAENDGKVWKADFGGLPLQVIDFLGVTGGKNE